MGFRYTSTAGIRNPAIAGVVSSGLSLLTDYGLVPGQMDPAAPSMESTTKIMNT